MGEAIETFKKHGISQMPLIADDNVIGVVAERTLLQRALEGDLDVAVSEVADMNYSTVDPDTEINVLTEMFRRYRLAIVYQNGKPADIITRIDLIDYMSRMSNGKGRK